MKNIFIISLLFLLSCKTNQSVSSTIKGSKAVFEQTENCPENGTCTIELIPNKSIEFKTDEFGSLYPVIEGGTKTILKYTFTKKTIPNTEDSNYTEIIYAELDKNISSISLIDQELKTINLHFARLCFCKGESGYFPIKKGTFNLVKNSDNTLKIDINFNVKKIPQIISEIHEIITL